MILTLEATKYEPRLDQALWWWAVRGASLLSLPRIDYMMRQVPFDLSSELAEFGARVWSGGQASPSWRTRARKAGFGKKPRPDRLKGRAAPMILYPAAALLRMRSLVGIGTKPDLLVCLASRGSQASTVATLARALGYAETSIREAGSQIARAGGARVRPEPPLAYTYRPHVLNLGELPPWRFWPQLVGFLLGASRWGEQLKTPTAFLLADEARRLMHGLRSAWTEHPFPAAYPIADPDMYPGEAFLEPFADTVETVAVWLADGLPG